MVRDRLKELHAMVGHSMRSSKRDKAGSGRSSKGSNRENEPNLQTFLADMDTVSSTVDAIERNNRELCRLHGEALTQPGPPDEAKRRRMADIAAENSRLAKKAREVIKESRRSSSNDWHVRRTQTNAQAQRLATAWAEYNNAQVDFHERWKQLLARKCRVAGVDLSEEQLLDRLESGDASAFAGALLRQEHVERRRLGELEDRHRHFLALERSLAEVQAMFADVAALVEEQGGTVGRIEAQVEAAAQNVQSGKEEVKQAHRYQRRARKRKVYLSIAVGAVVIVLVVLLVLLV